jgi:hypothetical protein
VRHVGSLNPTDLVRAGLPINEQVASLGLNINLIQNKI